ncbi:PLC-like phosphodiesterase [Fistulina hepatica ATCC 64428]|uniref:Phosphoinositide phospholipase C n=1 Tax=Fistulina hepatica ATCC 64428 TaxID=1128425 RepID=A0A0D7A0E3_9AGAR|nr:PLC-like phosphodiesterase [Fistulina hepatica ATCC 64428]
MTYSLSAYFISASHNTYLVGHQLVGESTIEGYIRALLAGCRSVEVDIYDGPTEPMIFHGKTLTSKVSLRQVCEAIHKYGFVASPYPIIISAEMHCGLVQQDMVAQIMMSIFGDALVRRREFVPEAMALELKSSSPRGSELHRSPTVEDVEFRQATVQFLPSPEDLKGRILLKTRNFYVSGSRSDVEGDVSTEPSASSTSDSDAFEAQLHRSMTEEFSYRRDISPGGIKDITRSMYDRVRGKTREPPPPVGPVGTIMAPSPHTGTNAKPKMAPMLRSTLVFTAGVKFRGINKKEEYAPEHMFSLSERVINRILKSPDETYSLIKHCRDHMVRVYPKGIRVTSTNYEPHRFWAAGAQLVALNWQTFDDGYMMNNAMFQRNDGLGYVLKPRALRCNTPSCKALLSRKTLHNLKITIISAQQLPRPRDSSGKDGFEKGKAAIIDPFVELSVFTPDWDNRLSGSPPHSQVDVEAPRDRSGSVSSQPRRYRTSVVKNNGFNPVWEESFCLPFLCQGGMMDLVFLKILIKREDKEDEEPVALHCSSLGSLARGYRHLPLYDAQLSQYLFATLFVKIEVEDI